MTVEQESVDLEPLTGGSYRMALTGILRVVAEVRDSVLKKGRRLREKGRGLMMEKKIEGHDDESPDSSLTSAEKKLRRLPCLPAAGLRPAPFSASHRYVNATILGCDFAGIYHSLVT
jgi:hypothetical protein